MSKDNVVSMVDGFNVKSTIYQIKEFEHLLYEVKYIPRWKYIIVDEISGKYVSHHVHHGTSLAQMDTEFIFAIKFDEAPLYDLVGSIGLFFILAAVMYFSRKIEWNK